MLNVVIIGASGYAGAELALLVHKHPELNLKGLYVSAGSQDANKPFSALHPQCLGLVDLPVKPLDDAGMEEAKTGTDLVCLATAHEVSMICLVHSVCSKMVSTTNIMVSRTINQNGCRKPFMD